MKGFLKIYIASFIGFMILFSAIFIGADRLIFNKNNKDLFSSGSGEQSVEKSVNIDSYIKNKKRLNILLLGADGGRSDTMMVLSIDLASQNMKMLSIPRDTYYHLEGYDSSAQRKINAIYGHGKGKGGAEGVRKAIEDLTQLDGDRDITIDWEILIQKLKLKRAEIAQQAREKFSQIAAGILVNEALLTLRQQENELIRERLQNDLIRDPLKRLTGKYEQVDLEEDQLMVYDGLGRFALSELSTGAQEQVLLALRIAFSRKVFGQDALFLILDDAFQHSDWQRRERLVAEMVSVAQQGWQIIYFTMDDHIRDLFHQLVRPEFNDQYCFRDLSANVTVGS